MYVNDFHISSSNFVVSHCSCLYGGIITHVALFDWLTLDFFCLTLQAMVFDFLYCLLRCVRFIVNFIMYGVVAALVYQFTRFMGEITVYSDIGAWHCEFVVHRSALVL